MINLIGIGYKKEVGKDTVARIIQCLTAGYPHNQILIALEHSEFPEYPLYTNKKFADKLKDMVCLLIGCTRAQLEDPQFKGTPLGEDWKVVTVIPQDGPVKKFNSNQEAENWIESLSDPLEIIDGPKEEILTPRKLLQELGTEVCRQIQPQMWVNALFADYGNVWYMCDRCMDEDVNLIKIPSRFKEQGYYEDEWVCGNCKGEESEGAITKVIGEYPSWIISDVRFPDEAQAIKNRNGIVIRVDRPESSDAYNSRKLEWASEKAHNDLIKKHCQNISEYPGEAPMYDDSILWEGENYKEEYQDEFNDLYDYYCSIYQENEHTSETALDDYEDWDWVIQNDGTIEDLVVKVEEMLKRFKII